MSEVTQPNGPGVTQVQCVRGARVASVASAVPAQIVTNQDLEKRVDTTDQWIRERTGIEERRIAPPEFSAIDFAHEAAEKALARAQVSADQLDLIVVATLTPDHPFPATACLLQNKLGAKCGAFDLEAGCTGFIYALTTAAQFIQSGGCDTVLVVGVDLLSRITDWKDRTTCVLFGDGAGAAVMTACEPGDGLLAWDLGSDGAGGPLLMVPAGGSKLPITAEAVAEGKHYIAMNGREVFKFAVRIQGESAERALSRCGLTGADVDCFVPHQANLRIIDAAMKRLSIPREKVYVNVQRYGNTSGASIPIALDEAQDEGFVFPGATVVCCGFGAGLTWGSCVLRW
ncbi:MAG: 3-oxoacyl-ACP synthase [Armatimonadetes bacterium CG_4_10_14_3_um_filter_66_18]|nr:ketoacyl-ACP synthase III [Armatimonadota bacterium]PIU93910.1 MAG: 3-oxoacyl-ACP synthase [Armatimonadetes bacterium CG06_land_8_20_14_3_00_66_21]PIX46933.1 MAG: 3-oxoacyl-ACP synthase [Armatimonadetes bacterium CG_4_8_14_3_um_filter_66_20]PIY39983.1 MAG: 3-oxoacyl-ACP synthase [Armatimonadetes bacterium CG_4_10_14_3_um_filter_66_18]PIZ32954.1 MAG: 3-oxoacyl-ACP synthase [Armatimonadetes bacterium CG_4_10_14_0_8_um_filter_66_14]PJB68163.1 MAG: 3-oxoacyl-ACP synthase [Armatimonadetes bacter